MSDDLTGYVEATSQESVGVLGAYGVKIFVKMARPLDRDMDIYGQEGDDYSHTGISFLSDQIRNRLMRTTVLTDPERPAKMAELEAAFRSLFDTPIFVRQIPNEYSGDPYYVNRPWFEVTTPVGLFTLGWRKRVISIDWSKTVGTKFAFELFANESTTMSGRTIHAWTYAKARAYIQAIHAGMPLPKCP